jgi:SAM-dependent methyltransferase
MLTYDCKVFDIFREKFSIKIKQELKGYTTPSLLPPVGEESVIRSFSKEWLEYNWDPNKYWKIKPELMYKSMRFMLDIDNRPVKNKRMLEIGIGIGGIADYFSSKELSELVGIDLSYSVDAAYKNFGENKFLHIVQASAFRLPIKNNSFDYVYSQGVLHHSSDPKACFMEVCKTPKEKGYFYVWLYNNVNENRNLLRRSIMIMEKMLRPLIWPMPYFLQSIILTPIALLYIIYEYYSQISNKEMVSYSWREAFHSARDRFTPRYAFRYSEEEIAGWYKEAGYVNLSKISQRKIPDYLGHDFYLATAMIGQKG